jgi:antitoxin CcdA
VALVALAKELNVNISQACETGLAAQVREARAAKWLEENREAIAAYDKWVEENGVTLERFTRIASRGLANSGLRP